MDSLIMWGGYVVAAIITIISVVLLQKKSNSSDKELDRAEKLDAQVSSLTEKLGNIQQTLHTKELELVSAIEDRDKSASKLESLENDYESKIDDVVQSSIDKISHAEEAKDEAVKAAEDNYEAAAEAYGQIKEKDKIIAELQKKLES